MSHFDRLDRVDALILAILQRDGRTSYADIGSTVGMSAPSVHDRVKKLEARGVILGYAARVDPAAVGRSVLAFISVKQAPGSTGTDLTGDFEAIAEIEDCHHVAGNADYLLKVRATDTRDLERLLIAVRSVPHVFAAETEVVLSTAFEQRPVTVTVTTEKVGDGVASGGDGEAAGAADAIQAGGSARLRRSPESVDTAESGDIAESGESGGIRETGRPVGA